MLRVRVAQRQTLGAARPAKTRPNSKFSNTAYEFEVSSIYYSSTGPRHPSLMPFSRAVPESLLTRNATWSDNFYAEEPELAQALSDGQHPKVFWIGCSDSRVPESVVCNARPGELFVLRNIANQFHIHDDSAVSALMFAVQVLGVEHIIVVGHTNCGGVNAAIKQVLDEQNELHEIPQSNALNRYLTPLTQLARYLRARIKERNSLSDKDMHARLLPALTEASVRRQPQSIVEHPVVQDNWAQKVSPLNGKVNPRVALHGWIHNISSGKLMDLNIDILPPPLESQEK